MELSSSEAVLPELRSANFRVTKATVEGSALHVTVIDNNEPFEFTVTLKDENLCRSSPHVSGSETASTAQNPDSAPSLSSAAFCAELEPCLCRKPETVFLRSPRRTTYTQRFRTVPNCTLLLRFAHQHWRRKPWTYRENAAIIASSEA